MVAKNLNVKESKELRKRRILKALEKNSTQPLSVDAIAHITGLHWLTAKALLLELMAEGKIAGMKTSKAWVFGLPQTMKVVKLSKEA